MPRTSTRKSLFRGAVKLFYTNISISCGTTWLAVRSSVPEAYGEVCLCPMQPVTDTLLRSYGNANTMPRKHSANFPVLRHDSIACSRYRLVATPCTGLYSINFRQLISGIPAHSYCISVPSMESKANGILPTTCVCTQIPLRFRRTQCASNFIVLLLVALYIHFTSTQMKHECILVEQRGGNALLCVMAV